MYLSPAANISPSSVSQKIVLSRPVNENPDRDKILINAPPPSQIIGILNERANAISDSIKKGMDEINKNLSSITNLSKVLESNKKIIDDYNRLASTNTDKEKLNNMKLQYDAAVKAEKTTREKIANVNNEINSLKNFIEIQQNELLIIQGKISAVQLELNKNS